MQQVYSYKNLDNTYDSPDNRGWMNLMHRWSFSRMLRYTWSMTAGTYSAKFQTFCEYHLDLEIGRLEWSKRPLAFKNGQPDLEMVAGTGDIWRTVALTYGLDFYESLVIREFLRYHPGMESSVKVYALTIGTEDPTTEKSNGFAQITAGFAITGMNEGKEQILFIRIRPSMRNMGLFQQAMAKMPKSIHTDMSTPILSTEEITGKEFKDKEVEDDIRRYKIYREIYELKQNLKDYAWLEDR
jgi:hypothetical protein